MDKSLYIGMTGATQNMTAQTINANNMANASTTGFRADLAHARAMQVVGEGLPSRVYSAAASPGTDFTQGPLEQTGNELDIALDGDGWVAVLGADGSEAYTRAGDLQLTPFGELQTASGQPVLGNAGPVALPPSEKIEIGSDGTISIREQGQGPEIIAMLDRIKLVNPDTALLAKGEDGLFRRRDGLEEAADGNVRVVSGYLESSNVNVVDAMVEMISLTRSYEMNIKVMQNAQQNSEASAQLLRLQ